MDCQKYSCTEKSSSAGKVWTVRSTAALRGQAVLARYGLSEVQLHREVKQCWQGMDCQKYSCTEKSSSAGKVWTVRSTAALRSQAVLARYGSSEVQLQ